MVASAIRYSLCWWHSSCIFVIVWLTNSTTCMWTGIKILRYVNKNVNKSCCIRIGPRFNVKCSAINTINGDILPWVTELLYLGIYLINFRVFCCSHDQAKRAYHRSLNAIFGKVGRIASEEVVLQLVSSKCLPILMYGTEACGLKKSVIRSLDFTVNRFLIKLFKTGNISVIKECSAFFNFLLPSTMIVNRTKIFLRKYNNCDNFLCKLFSTVE